MIAAVEINLTPADDDLSKEMETKWGYLYKGYTLIMLCHNLDNEKN